MAQQKRYSDLDPIFSLNPLNKDIPIKYDGRAISFSIKNIILTMYGERPFNPDFGQNIKQLMFGLAGDKLKIVLKEVILTAIINNEPRVIVENIDIEDSIDNNLVYISITYRIRNTESIVTTQVALERTR